MRPLKVQCSSIKSNSLSLGLATNTALRILDISEMFLTRGIANGRQDHNEQENYEVDLTGVEALCTAIERNGTLTELNVCGNNIPIERMEHLVKVVDRSPTLQVLCLVPIKNCSLTRLDLSGRKLQQDVHAILAFFHHPPDPGHLALGPFQAIGNLLAFFFVQHDGSCIVSIRILYPRGVYVKVRKAWGSQEIGGTAMISGA